MVELVPLTVDPFILNSSDDNRLLQKKVSPLSAGPRSTVGRAPDL